MAQIPKKILVIDDNKGSLLSLKSLIADLFGGFFVYTAASGIEGIELAKIHRPDVILLDILMPDLDGYDVCKTLKKDKDLCSIPVVFITSLNENHENKVRALEAGAEGFLSKPVDKSELLAQIKAMIRIKEAIDLNKSEKHRLEKMLAEKTKELQEELKLNRDISEKLSKSEERFRVAQELSPDGFTILHPLRNKKGEIVDFTWVYENSAVARINSTNPGEIIGKRLLELFPNHKGTSVFESYLIAANTGKTQIIEDVYVGEIVSVPTWLRLVIVSIGEDIAILAQNITEQKLTIEKLNYERQRLLNVLDVMPMMVCLLTPDYHVPFANRAFRNKFGDANGRLCYEYCFNKNEPCDFCESYRVLDTGKPHRWEVSSPYGSTFLEAYDFPFTDVDGSPMILEVDVDITDRKKAEEELRKSEEKYRTLFHQSMEGIYIHDFEGRVLDVNDIACSQSGYSREEWLGLTVFDGQSDSTTNMKRDDVINAWSKWEPGQRFVLQSEHRKKDGTVYPVEVSTGKVSYGNENVLLAIVKDITEQKKAEIALQKSEQNYREIFNSTTEAIFVYDSETGAILDANESGLLLYGYTYDEVLRLTLEDFSLGVSPYSMEEAKQWLHKVFTDGAQTFEWKSRKKNGEIFWVEVSLKIVSINGHQKILSVVRDISASKKAEEALQASFKMLSLFIKNSPIYAYLKEVTPNESRVLFASENFFDMIGIPGSQIAGKKMEELFPPEFARKIAKDDWEVVQKGDVIKLEENLNDRIYTTIKFPVSIGGRNLLAGYTIDITENKNIELELIRAKEKAENNEIRLMEAQAVTKVGSWETDLSNLNVFWSEETFKIFDLDSDTFSPHHNTFLEYVHPDDRERVDEAFKDSFSTERFNKVEHKIITARGNIKFIEERWRVVKDNEGNPVKAYGTCQDITDRKNIEIELFKAKVIAEENERKLEAAQEIAKMGSWELDIKTDIFTFTDSFYKMFHTTAEEMGGYQMTIDDYAKRFVYPEDASLVADETKLAIESADPNFTKYVEHRIMYADGGIGYISVKIFIVKDEFGNTIKAFGVNQDITEKKIAEVELLKAKEKAEESDRLKSAFLANMSHEIRTPMNGILGFTELLKEQNLSGKEQQEYIELINKSGNRMLSIINDIIDISRIEAGLMKFNLAQSNVADQIDYIHTFFKPEAAAKGLNLSVKNSLPRNQANINTDREKLYAILTNLVKNAIKFTKKGEIEIGCAKKGGFIEFYVKDTGIGIPNDRQHAIFERFIQADIEDSMALQGAGLGLSISKAFLEMLGGKIWVESEEGKGSTFFFTLPYDNTKKIDNVPQSLSNVDTKNNIRKLKTLVVEDDMISEILLEKAINKISKEILKAKTGVDAVNIVRANPDIDLILMDIRLPELSGYKAVRQIREFNKNVVIIAQTAYGLSGDMKKAKEAGCTDYIAKPIIKEELLKLISKYFPE